MASSQITSWHGTLLKRKRQRKITFKKYHSTNALPLHVLLILCSSLFYIENPFYK